MGLFDRIKERLNADNKLENNGVQAVDRPVSYNPDRDEKIANLIIDKARQGQVGDSEIMQIPVKNMDLQTKEAIMKQLQADGFEVMDRPNGSTGPNIRIYASHEQFSGYKHQISQETTPPKVNAPGSDDQYLRLVDDEIAKAKSVLENWNDSADEIQEVRQLERPTQVIMHNEDLLNRGYYAGQATEGYNRLLSAFKILNEDDLSPAQNRALERALEVQDNLRKDAAIYGDRPTGEGANRYLDSKMDQLAKTGETYMVSGHKSHFNVTRIQKQTDGSYTYTLYDSGHETQVVGKQDGRLMANAVREHVIKPNADIRSLIEADMQKRSSDSAGSEYKQSKNFIEGSLKQPPVRTVEEFAQRRGNCTTRGQRIMVSDIVQDNQLSEKIYNFLNGANGTSDADIKHAIENRIEELEKIRDEGQRVIPIAAERQLSPEQYVKANNADNYQHVRIGLDNGERMDAYRTAPGLFSKDELDILQKTLQRNGTDANVRESVSSPGQYYLYVDPQNAESLHTSLKQDLQRYQQNNHLTPDTPNRTNNVSDLIVNNAEGMEAGGREIVKISTDGMNEQVKADLIAKLQQDGFEVTDRPHGSTGPNIRIHASHDKFAQYQQHVLNDAIAPKPRPNLSQIIVNNAEGMEAGGQEIMKISTDGMDKQVKADLIAKLQQDGFDVTDRPNGSTGPNIRIHASHDEFAQYQHRINPNNARVFSLDEVRQRRDANAGRLSSSAPSSSQGGISNNSSMSDTPMREAPQYTPSSDRAAVVASLDNGGGGNASSEIKRGQASTNDGSVENGSAAVQLDPLDILNDQPLPSETDVPDIQETIGTESVVDNDAPAANETLPPPDNVEPITGSDASADTENAQSAQTDTNEADIKQTNTPDDPSAKMTKVTAIGASGAGVGLGIVGLTAAIKSGDNVGIAVSGVDVAVSSGDAILDGASAAGKNVSNALRGAAIKANVLVTVVDGVYQISQEEGLENKAARTGAVALTTGTALTVGAAASTVVAGGALAATATVAAPIVAAVAVGMTADAAVGAFKATESLEDAIKNNEKPVRKYDDVEADGAPKLTNYLNLKLFAMQEGDVPDGSEGLTMQEKAQVVSEHEYSKDPEALDDLEAKLQAKIDHYDEIIEENDSWVHDSVRFFWDDDEIDAKRQAQMDRTHYAAALNELKEYRKELEEFEGDKPEAEHSASEENDLDGWDLVAGNFEDDQNPASQVDANPAPNSMMSPNT
ncbi:MAG: hypothetical protein ACRBDL_06180 [Alphaproteobacteria bacterium]